MTTITDYNYKTSISIRFSDIDAFGHVNNAVYLTYFEIARSSYWNDVIKWDWEAMGIIIGKAEINYVKPINLNDEIFAYVRTSRVGKSSFDLDYVLVRMKNGIEEICTKGSTVCISYDYQNNKPAAIPDIQKFKMLEFEAIAL
ncbi:acyl-CoA thioesterase [Daejeonella oryzae]|uniref:acyl-CoA thioesterase n=1 Tax=Daejeonella oryzae TaxID=1122943 RepID=UPI000417CD18|nr:thioesterase family protein [Daejeonella oryzae]